MEVLFPPFFLVFFAGPFGANFLFLVLINTQKDPPKTSKTINRHKRSHLMMYIRSIDPLPILILINFILKTLLTQVNEYLINTIIEVLSGFGFLDFYQVTLWD